jgi:hypothetical protein
MKNIISISIIIFTLVFSQITFIGANFGLVHAQETTQSCLESDDTCDLDTISNPADFPSLDSSTPQQSSIAAQLEAAAQTYNQATNNFINSNPGIAALYKTQGANVGSLLKLDSTSFDKLASQFGLNSDSIKKISQSLQTDSATAANILSKLGLGNTAPGDLANKLKGTSLTDFATKLGIDPTSATAIASQLGLGTSITGINGPTGLSTALGGLGGLSGLSGALGGIGSIAGIGGGDVNKTGVELNGYDEAQIKACFTANSVCKIDRRVLAELTMLSTTGGDQGKGHLIKVSRIIKNYGTDNQAKSKETDYSKDESQANISAHSKGEAFDISEIDQYQCTNSDGSKTPPKPILVVWQDQAPGTTVADPNNPATTLPGTSANTGIANNIIKAGNTIFNSAVINGINESTNLTIGTNLSTVSTGASLPATISMLGKTSLEQDMGIKIPSQSQASLTDTAKAIGQSILASSTNISPIAFGGGSQDEFLTNLSKVNLAQQLGLNPNSLSGNNIDSWLTSAATGYIENTLNLRTGSLSGSRAQQGINGIATAQIETILNLKNNSWNNDLNIIIKNNNNQPISALLQAPASYDQQLNLPIGTTQKLIDGSLSPSDFVKSVSGSIKKNYIDPYNNGQNADLAWNVPSGTLNNLLNNTNTNATLKSLGAKVLGSALNLPQDQINNLINQASKGSISKIDVSHSPTNVSLSSGDFVKVFDNSTMAGILKSNGQDLLKTITGSTNQNLYSGLTTDVLKQLGSTTQSADQIALKLGLQQIESDLGLDSGSLDKIITAPGITTATVKTILGDDNLNSIANDITQGLNLNKLPSLYQINGDDIANFIATGRDDVIVQKAGSNIFDKIINAQPGYTQDATFGRISFNSLLADGTLKTLTNSIGLPLSPTVNNQSMLDILRNNTNNLSNQNIASIIGLDSNKQYNLSLNGVLDILKSSDNPSFDSAQGELGNLGSEILSAQYKLPSGTIGKIISDPTTTGSVSSLVSLKGLEDAIGLPAGTISNSYTQNSILSGFTNSSAIDTIMKKTGITNSADAQKLLNGNFEEGLEAVAIGSFVKNINSQVTNQDAKLNYDTLAKAVFGDPASLNTAISNLNSSDPTAINTAIRIASQDQANNANFSILDAKININNPSLPAGISKILISGSDQEKGDLLVKYAQNLNLPTLTDTSLSQLTGIPIPAGTVTSIANGTFNSATFGKNFLNSTQGSAWLDKSLGLASGSTASLLSGYKQYQGLTASFKAGTLSASDFNIARGALALSVADKLTGGAISALPTKLTSSIDGALGLPAGSTVQIGLSIATGNYLQAGVMLAGAMGIDVGGLLGPLGGLGGIGGIAGLGGSTTCPDLQKLAQAKVKQLTSEVMAKATADKDSDANPQLIPSQILTWRTEDIDYLNKTYPAIYGPTGRFGKAGISKSLNPLEVHVGF